jgi:uncharacterized protein GlcG (DUF336 family)
MEEITLEQARTIIRTVFEAGREAGMRPLAAVVVDAGGHVQAFERQEGTPPGRFDIARGKAYGAVMLGMGGFAQRDRAEAQAYFMEALNGVYGGALVPVPGGVLVRGASGRVIGAVGVTGDTSENDAEAALTGIRAAGLSGEA